MIEGLWDLQPAADYVSFYSLAFLLEALVLLWIGKLIKDVLTPYSINAQLTDQDNKALAVSYVGYMVAQGIVILGVYHGESTEFVPDLINVGIWGLIGILLLNISTFISDKLILRKFKTVKEIIEDRNVGTGAVECGMYLGTGFLIHAVIKGDSGHWQADLMGAGIFFLVGQIAFIVFSFVYQGITSYDLNREIEEDNVAAGVGFGMTLAAVGVLISNTITKTTSIPAFCVWFVNGVVLIVVARFLVDRLILPGNKLDTEIQKDRNWGAALIEGGCAIIVAFLLNASFTP